MDSLPSTARVAYRYLTGRDDVFGPNRPLGEWDGTKVKYRVKSNSGGVAVAVYYGRTNIGGMNAFTERYPENQGGPCDKDVRALADRYPQMVTGEWKKDDGEVWRYVTALAVYKAFITVEEHQHKGIGKRMYLALMADWFQRVGPYIFLPYYCSGSGGTSTDAKRVWDSLAREFPSKGHAVAVLRAPKVEKVSSSSDPRSRGRRTAMYSPRDLRHLALRIEQLMQTRTHGWHAGDDLELRNMLPGSRVRDPRRVLPSPEDLRRWAQLLESREDSEDVEKTIRPMWRVWLPLAMRAEGLARDNDPRNPKRMMRDMARGRFPYR